VQQRQHEENLRQREQELAAREIAILERELTVMIIQQQNTPTPNKRRGKFKKSRLKLNKKEPGSNISAPSGKNIYLSHTFIVLQSISRNQRISHKFYRNYILCLKHTSEIAWINFGNVLFRFSSHYHRSRYSLRQSEKPIETK